MERQEPDENQILFRAVFETSQDAIGVSKGGIHSLVNPTYLALFGYERSEQLVGTPILDLIDPSEHARVRDYVRRRSLGEPVPGAYETVGLRRDGTPFAMDVRASAYVWGGEAYTLVVLRDVTPQREAERALRESQEVYRAMFEVNTAIKLLIDPSDGAIVNANGAAIAFYGWSLAELRSMKITDINVARPDEVHEALGRTRSGQANYFSFRHRTARSGLRDMEVYTGPLQVGGRTLLFSILHDVTERLRLQEELRQAQKLEAIGRLAGGIAHDFNNLLTVMLGYADEIAQQAAEGHARRQAEELVSAAVRASELTKQLLAFSRGQRLQPRVLCLSEVVQKLVPMLRRLIGEDVLLQADVGAPDGWTLADEGQIAQVLLNLVVNARDAMPGGGRLAISTDATAEGAPDAPGPGAWVSLTVTDTGIGMDETTRERVFEPFFTTKDVQGGTGLGLATVYGIVRQSGGHVRVTSAPGAGATFTLHLPRVPPPAVAEVPAPRASDVQPGAGRVVMVVEDQDDVRTFLAWRLRGAGYEVLDACDAEQALAIDAAHAGPLDLLVTDVVMPGLRGPELYVKMKERRPGLRALYVSGWTEGRADASGEDGGPPMLPKPFTGKELLAAVRDVLERL